VSADPATYVYGAGADAGRLAALDEAVRVAFKMRTLAGLRKRLERMLAEEAARRQEVAYDASAEPEARP
jgi:hypothetical protein